MELFINFTKTLTMEIFTLKLPKGNYEVYPKFSRYPNGNTRLDLIESTGIPLCTATFNGGLKLGESQLLIKDYHENKGMVQALVNASVVSSPLSYNHYPDVFICNLSSTLINQFYQHVTADLS